MNKVELEGVLVSKDIDSNQLHIKVGEVDIPVNFDFISLVLASVGATVSIEGTITRLPSGALSIEEIAITKKI